MCGSCRIALEMLRRTRREPRRGRSMTEIKGWRCPDCGAGFNKGLAPDHTRGEEKRIKMS